MQQRSLKGTIFHASTDPHFLWNGYEGLHGMHPSSYTVSYSKPAITKACTMHKIRVLEIEKAYAGAGITRSIFKTAAVICHDSVWKPAISIKFLV